MTSVSLKVISFSIKFPTFFIEQVWVNNENIFDELENTDDRMTSLTMYSQCSHFTWKSPDYYFDYDPNVFKLFQGFWLNGLQQLFIKFLIEKRFTFRFLFCCVKMNKLNKITFTCKIIINRLLNMFSLFTSAVGIFVHTQEYVRN